MQLSIGELLAKSLYVPLRGGIILLLWAQGRLFLIDIVLIWTFLIQRPHPRRYSLAQEYMQNFP